MTRLIIICSLFLAMVSVASFKASAGTQKTTEVTVSDLNETGTTNHQEPLSASKSSTGYPAANTVPPLHQEEKGHTLKLDELPHIHHFHKERVKKVKRHHKKVWSISMLILVLCHISILIMAFMHVAPH
jgi:hypothetical protein